MGLATVVVEPKETGVKWEVESDSSVVELVVPSSDEELLSLLPLRKESILNAFKFTGAHRAKNSKKISILFIPKI